MNQFTDGWTGGLEPEIDFMLTGKPDNLELRESASIWLYEENGEFAFPRIGIEAIGASWDRHDPQLNFATPDGRAMVDRPGPTLSHSPFGPNGKPTILGTGGLRLECIEPFHKWRASYQGRPIDTTAQAMIQGAVNQQHRADLCLEVEITMAAPAWTQDLRPERLATMNEAERIDAGLMGFGWRVEQTFRAEGKLTLDGRERSFRGVGNRIHRQSVRPLGAFRGHCWQAAVFPDGRAFALCAYPPRNDGTTYNDGYVYIDGKMYRARGRKIPHIKGLVATAEDVSLELEYELGVAHIGGVSSCNTFKVGISDDAPGFILHQGAVRYTWEDQTAFGMIERSNWASQLA